MHHRAKFSRFCVNAALAKQCDELLIQRDRDFRPSRIDKAWSPPFGGVTIQRELRHHEDRAVDVGEREVHFALAVGENPQADDLVSHPHQLFVAIGVSETHQQHVSAVNSPRNALGDTDFGSHDPLKQHPHVMLSAWFVGCRDNLTKSSQRRCGPESTLHAMMHELPFTGREMLPTSLSRRALYRVSYPIGERPTLDMGRLVHEIVDCSEQGLRYHVLDLRMPEIGTLLGGIIKFRRGRQVEVTGEVTRASDGLVVLVLDSPGIRFSDILLEQRYLRGKGFSLKD